LIIWARKHELEATLIDRIEQAENGFIDTIRNNYVTDLLQIVATYCRDPAFSDRGSGIWFQTRATITDRTIPHKPNESFGKDICF